MSRNPCYPAWLPWRPRDVLSVLAQGAEPQPVAVLLVLRAEGSTPAKAGTRALLFPDGSLVGTVGGGAVEAEACRQARIAAECGQRQVFEIQLDGPPGPICGGRMRLLVDRLPGRHRQAYAQAEACLRQRRAGLLLTRVQHGAAMEVQAVFLEAGELQRWEGWPTPQQLETVWTSEEPRLFALSEPAGLEYEALAEPLRPAPQLVIAGGGHVGQAVAAFGYQLGMDIVVIDDRPEFAHPDRFPPGSQVRCGPIVQELAGVALDAASYVVIVTRNHELDAEALEVCLHRPAAYLGMIGSRRKLAQVRHRLVASGRASPDAFERIRTPIGLDLGAVTVPEIALSILAEIIAVRRQKGGKRPAGEEGR